MRSVRWLGRNLRHLVLPLIGYWDIRRLLEQANDQQQRTEDQVRNASDRILRGIGILLDTSTKELKQDAADIRDDIAKQGETIARHGETIAKQGETIAKQGETIARQGETIAKQGETIAGHIGRLEANMAQKGAALTSTVETWSRPLDGYLAFHAGELGRQLAFLSRRSDELETQLLAIKGTGDRLFWVQPQSDAVFVCAGFDLVVPANEAGLIAFFVRHGVETVERGVRTLLRTRLRSGCAVVSIGSNVGIHAVPMAQAVGPSGTVICIEPIRHIADALERSLRLNQLSTQAKVLCIAAADSDSGMNFYKAEHSPLSSFYPITTSAQLLHLPTVTVDQLFAPGAQVDLVQMDVEGAEPLVYEGMKRIVYENKNLELVLEWSASHFVRSGHDPAAFAEKLRGDGFRPHLIAEDGTITICSNLERLEGANIFFSRATGLGA
jgi:FkbM family methyltransferase